MNFKSIFGKKIIVYEKRYGYTHTKNNIKKKKCNTLAGENVITTSTNCGDEDHRGKPKSQMFKRILLPGYCYPRRTMA